jgi:HK97 family phage major capsid protein/HK97 family phage prohead protease
MLRRAYSLLNVKAIEERGDEYIITGIASTPTPDRMGDIVEPLGAKFALPMPLLWQHNSEKPVGRVEFAKPTKNGIPYSAALPKVKEAGALKDRIEEAVQSMKYGLVAAVSIGFRALEGGYELLKNGGLRFTDWEWLELSLVTIPANPDAKIDGVNVKSLLQPEAREVLLERMKSIDRQHLAALGRKGAPPGDRAGPGASGHQSRPPQGGLFHSRSQKGNAMNLKEMIEARSTKNARLKELIDLRTAEARQFEDDEAAEFDALTDEVKQLDDDIRVAKYHAVNSSAATAVDTKAASGRRGPDIIVRKEDPEDKFQGQSFVRFVIAKTTAQIIGGGVRASDIAQRMYGKSHPGLVQWIKANEIAPGGTGSGEWGSELAAPDSRYTGDFIALLRQRTAYWQLPLRTAPANVTIKGQDGGATANWVGEHKPIPLSKLDFMDLTLTHLKVAAIARMSKDLIKFAAPSAEQLVLDDLVRACAQKIDSTFFSDAAAVSGISPAGILNGVVAESASGADGDALRHDFGLLEQPFIDGFYDSDLWVVTTPQLGGSIGRMVNPLGQSEFPGVGKRGGRLFDNTVVTGHNVGPGDLILLSPSDIYRIGDTGVEVSVSDTATIESSSAPASSGTTTTASENLQSMFQNDQVAIKVVQPMNFAKRRSSAVQYIGDAAYGVAAGLSTN